MLNCYLFSKQECPYSYKEFGFNRAVKYVKAFEDFFEQLITNPNLGKIRDEIKPGLRSFPKEKHIFIMR